MELQPGDRRGRQTAGGRHRDHGPQPRAQRISLEKALEARDEDEDRDHRRKRELKAGVEERVRVPGEQDDRPDEQQMPAVGRARGEPGERAERTGDPGTDDRRLGADREHVGPDRRECAELAEQARQAEQPGEQHRTGGDERDVLSGHREQVIEPRRAEAATQLVRETVVLAEHHAFDDRGTFTVEPSRDRMPQTSSNRVRDPADSATTTDDPPVVDTQDDVDAVPAKPGSLVEPVLGAARRSHDHERLQDGSLRRCASARQLQQDRLAQRQPAEALDDGRRANVELAGMHRARDDQLCTLRRVDSRAQRTAIERVETVATPAPAEQREGACDEQQPLRPGDAKSGRPDQSGEDERDGTVHPHRVRAARPRQSEAASSCGERRTATSSLTARPGRGASRAARARCPRSHRARRRTRTPRASGGSRGSSAR